MKTTSKPSLASLHDLFSSAWLLTRKKIAKLLIINSLFVATLLAVYGILLGVVVIGFLFASYLGFDFRNLDLSVPGVGTIMVGLISISFSLFLIPSLFIDGWAKAASYAALAEVKPKSGWGHWWVASRVVHISGLSILLKTLISGGLMYLLIFPMFISLFYFMFVVQVVVFENKKYFSALGRSVQIVHYHFGELLLKLLAPYLLLYLAQGALSALLSQLPSIITILLVPLVLIFQVLSIFFLLAYSFVLYQTASENTPTTAPKPLRVLVLLSLVGILVGAAIWCMFIINFINPGFQLLAQTYYAKQASEAQIAQSQAIIMDQKSLELSESEATKLSEDILMLLNQRRAEVGLEPLVQDSNLCRYAQRRHEDFEESGFDEGVGLRSDLEDESVASDFFQNSAGAIEEIYFDMVTKAATAEGLVERAVAMPRDYDQVIVLSKSSSLICVATTKNSVYFLATGKN